MSLIEESLGFSAFRHYAVDTRLKQSVDQWNLKNKTLNDWNIMSLTTKQLFSDQMPLKNQDLSTTSSYFHIEKTVILNQLAA